MKFGLLTSGSRGDVQPFVALAAGMKRAGFDIAMVTHEPFRSFITAHDLEFRSIGGDPRTMLESAAGKELLAQGDNAKVFIKKMVELSEPHLVEVAEHALAALQDVDVLLCSTSLLFIGEALAEKLGCQLIYVSLQPIAPTGQQRGMFETALPRSLNFLYPLGFHRLAQIAGLQYYSHVYKPIYDRLRKDVLKIRPRSRWLHLHHFYRGPLYLYGYSKHVVPRPTDWGQRQQVCGYWFLDQTQEWQPQQRLVDFLKDGPVPVYVGFGSMPSEDPDAAAKLVIEALKISGQRAVVLQGWGGFPVENWPDSVCVVDSVPHDWLFPQMSAVVHHGGAGTTSVGLRAGTPTVVIPHIADQPFWGRRVQELGAGPEPVLRKKLTASALATALKTAVNTPSIRASAEKLGQLIRAEDGIATAISQLQSYLSANPRKS